MQELGLTADYKSREDGRHFEGMLDGLAFLPLDVVDAEICYLRVQSFLGRYERYAVF